MLEQRLNVSSSDLNTFLLACHKHLASKFVTHSPVSSFMNLKTLLLKELNLMHTSRPKDPSCHLCSVSLSEVAKFRGAAVLIRRQSALCICSCLFLLLRNSPYDCCHMFLSAVCFSEVSRIGN